MWDGQERRGSDERIVVLETEMKQIQESQQSISDKLDSISNELTRYKGFMGGVAFLLGAIVTVVGLGRDYILSHFK